MKIGKLPDSVLNELVIEPIVKNGAKREEVLLTPSIGEDCSAIDFGDNICICSTDPITGAVNDIGRLAVHINANDIAAGGGEPVGIMVTALLPPSITEKEIKTIMRDFYSEAAKIDLCVIGGHTEVTDAVTKPVLSCTVLGKCKRVIASSGAMAGDKMVMTKYAALEGSAIFAADKAELLKGRVSEECLLKARSFVDMLSVTKEGKLAADFGAHAMHDVTEGGILGACWEVATCSGLGVCVDTDKIPILEETKLICSALNVDPYRLISSGSMLIACEDGEGLVALLAQNGINSAVIGEFTADKEMHYIKNGEKLPLPEPDTDELYKV